MPSAATPSLQPIRLFSRRVWQVGAGLFLVVAIAAALWGLISGEIRTPGDLVFFFVDNRLLTLLISGLAALSLLAGLIYLFTLQGRLSLNKRISDAKRQEFRKKIAEVKGLIKLGGASRYQSAVITMDALLDRALTLHGYQGTLAEKLNKTRQQFRNMDAIWRAHRHRNRLVHEPDTPVHKAEAQASVEALAQALRDLGAL